MKMVSEEKENQERMLTQRQEMDGLIWRKSGLTNCFHVDRVVKCQWVWGHRCPGARLGMTGLRKMAVTALKASLYTQSHVGVNFLSMVCVFLRPFSVGW